MPRSQLIGHASHSSLVLYVGSGALCLRDAQAFHQPDIQKVTFCRGCPEFCPANVSISQEFERELDVFRREAEGGTQFFYAYLTLHAMAADDRQVHRALNEAALFWNTSLAALQTATIISLGRIFDHQSPHNIDRLLKLAQDNPQLFAKESLGLRKQGAAIDPPPWLADYVASAYEPTPADFRRLRGHVKKRRRVYESSYRDLRRKIFAHLEIVERHKVEAMFKKTNVRELQKIFVFLSAFHEALWQLFFNGRKPSLRPQRYSVARIRDLPSPATRRQSVQERIVHEAESMARHLTGVAKPVPAVQRASRVTPRGAR